MDNPRQLVFALFNEIGIINQLSTTLLNRQLPDGLHSSHFGVLNHLTRRPEGQTPLAMASAFQVTKGTMTHTLAVLEKRGLVTIKPHPKDGRSKIASITDAGIAFHQKAVESLAPVIGKLDDKLDYEAIAGLLPELQRIRIILDENRDI